MDSRPKGQDSALRVGQRVPFEMRGDWSFILTWAHAALFGFFLWLLAGAVLRGDLFFSFLLGAAVLYLAWRVRHYATKYRAIL